MFYRSLLAAHCFLFTCRFCNQLYRPSGKLAKLRVIGHDDVLGFAVINHRHLYSGELEWDILIKICTQKGVTHITHSRDQVYNINADQRRWQEPNRSLHAETTADTRWNIKHRNAVLISNFSKQTVLRIGDKEHMLGDI